MNLFALSHLMVVLLATMQHTTTPHCRFLSQDDSQKKLDEALLERCESALKNLDAKACYRWTINPPEWARQNGKDGNDILPHLRQRALTLAVERDPKLVAPYLELGGIDYLTKAIELMPQFAQGYQLRGECYLLNQPQRAEEDFSTAFNLLSESDTHRFVIDGIVYEWKPNEHLDLVLHRRAIARVLSGNHPLAIKDLNQAIAQLERKAQKQDVEPLTGSFYSLQLAWIMIVHPEKTVRNLTLASQLIKLAESLEQKQKEQGKSLNSNITFNHRFNILKAALAAAQGNYSKAIEFESQVNYGNIQWGLPDANHDERLALYRAGKPIQTRLFWYLPTD